MTTPAFESQVKAVCAGLRKRTRNADHLATIDRIARLKTSELGPKHMAELACIGDECDETLASMSARSRASVPSPVLELGTAETEPAMPAAFAGARGDRIKELIAKIEADAGAQKSEYVMLTVKAIKDLGDAATDHNLATLEDIARTLSIV